MEIRSLIKRSNQRGISQLEILIGTVILCVVFLLSVQVFKSVAVGTVNTQVSTYADNLARERLNELAAKDFIGLPVSASTVAVAGPEPAVYSDLVNYPPVSRNYGPVTMTAYSHVQALAMNADGQLAPAQVSDWFSTVPRRLHVTVVWQEAGSWRQQSLSRDFSNPAQGAIQNNENLFEGIVTTTDSIPIEKVTVGGDKPLDWTLSDGSFSFMSYPQNLVLFRHPLFEELTLNLSTFPLVGGVRRGTVSLNRRSARLSGIVWVNDRLLITEVAAEIIDPGTGASQEYVELFNPTRSTYTIRADSVYLYSPNRIAATPALNKLACTYVNQTLYPGRFYLFASHPTINGTFGSRMADAYWNPVGANLIPTSPGAGSLELYDQPGDFIADRVGWQGAGGVNPPAYNAAPISETLPLVSGSSYSRFSSTSGVDAAYAPAYDSANNAQDWTPGVPSPMTTGWTRTNISGRVGSGVFLGLGYLNGYLDGGQGTVQTVIQPNSGRPYATYEIDQLEQGAWYPRTWGPGYSSRGYGPGSCNVFIHPAVTLATGQEAKNDFNLACPGTNTAWYPITGTLRNYSGTPIVGVQVNSDRTDINGNFVAVSQYLNAGKAILVFNRQPKWSLYQDSYVYTPVGTAGQVTSGVNLLLPGCAMIRFSAAMADGGPPSVSVDVKYIPVGRSWEDSYSLRPTHNAHAYCGISKTYSLSLASSRYYETVDFLSVLSGEYELSPLSVTLSPTELQQGTHINVPVTVTPRHWGVFGTARRGGEPIATGVIVAAMTASLPAGAPPPSPQSQAYYGAVTGADGAYELRLPDGTFNLYAWETRLVNGAAVTTRKDGSVVVSHNKQERSFDW